MAWTTWIEMEPVDTVKEEVARLYNRALDRTTGRPLDIVRLTSLTPRVAGLLYDLKEAVCQAAEGLTLREKEIAALLVSTYNGCVH